MSAAREQPGRTPGHGSAPTAQGGNTHAGIQAQEDRLRRCRHVAHGGHRSRWTRSRQSCRGVQDPYRHRDDEVRSAVGAVRTVHRRGTRRLAQEGAKVKITCRTKGQWVKGTRSTTNWWDKIGPGKYVSHAYIKTNLWIPVCKGSGSTNGSLPKAPRNNPHPSAMSQAPNLTERAAHVRKEMAKAFPGIQCDVSAYRPGQKSDHNSGNAIDCFPGRFGVFPKGATKKEGDQAAAWLRKYAGKLDVQYVIWQNKIWNKKPGLNEKGWREHRHAGQVTLGHYDHLHISVTAPVQY